MNKTLTFWEEQDMTGAFIAMQNGFGMLEVMVEDLDNLLERASASMHGGKKDMFAERGDRFLFVIDAIRNHMLDADEILNGDNSFRQIDRRKREALQEDNSDTNASI